MHRNNIDRKKSFCSNQPIGINQSVSTAVNLLEFQTLNKMRHAVESYLSEKDFISTSFCDVYKTGILFNMIMFDKCVIGQLYYGQLVLTWYW